MPLVKGRCPEIDTPVPCPVPVAVEVVVPGASVASALKFARDGRQIVDLFVGDDRRDRALRLDGDALSHDLHRLGDAAHLHRDIDREVLARRAVRAPAGSARTPASSDSHFVVAGPQVRQEVPALCAGHGCLHGVGLDLPHRDGHAGERAALLIEHGAAKGAQTGLGRRRSG